MKDMHPTGAEGSASHAFEYPMDKPADQYIADKGKPATEMGVEGASAAPSQDNTMDQSKKFA